MNPKLFRRSRKDRRPVRAASAAEPLEGRLLFSTYTVTTLGDGAGIVSANGSNFNATTLRAALNAANARAGADTVNFAAAVTGTINLGTALPRVNDPLTIAGPGASKLTVQRGTAVTASFTILRVNAGKAATVSGLRLARGAGDLVGTERRGGGVYNAGSMTLVNCALSGNRAGGANAPAAAPDADAGDGADGLGGAAYNAESAKLVLRGCTISGNAAVGGRGGFQASTEVEPVYYGYSYFRAGNGGDGRGGGVYNAGTLTIDGCTLSGNSALGGAGGDRVDHSISTSDGVGGDGTGGGIFNVAGTTLTGTAVTGNRATGGDGGRNRGGGSGGNGGGGGIFSAGIDIFATVATLVLADSTVSGDTATGGRGGPGLDGPGYNGGARGGGMFLAGTSSASDCTISGNTAAGSTAGSPAGRGDGGGVYNVGTLALTGSAIAGNTAVGRARGGGMAGGNFSVDRCSFSNNVARGAGAGGDGEGGGLYIQGTARVYNSTFSGNAATGGDGVGAGADGNNGSGGGIATHGTLDLANCTLTGNTATGGAPSGGVEGTGAGGAVHSFRIPVSITNCTVSGNSAEHFGGGLDPFGSNTLTISNSIVVGNHKTAGGTQVNEIEGVVKVADSFNNVIGTTRRGGLVNGVNGNKVGVTLAALKLGPLQSNGGPTRTMALLAGSPAIDAGNTAKASAVGLFADQRGLPRVRGARVDVGAFEVQPAGGGSVAGTLFNDVNRDGVRQAAELKLVGWQLYLDRNKNGRYDPGEMTTVTGDAGTYKFVGLTAGGYRVVEVRKAGWVRTKPTQQPVGYYDVTIDLSVNGGAVTGKDFGNYKA